MSQTADIEARLDELVAVASPYWAAEHEIARAFFSQPRSKAEHLGWLRAQCWKEFWGTLDGNPNSIVCRSLAALQDMYNRLEQDPSTRHEFLHTAEEMYEEFHHYTVLADIIDELEARHVPPSELEQIPEDAKLSDLRAQIARSEGAIGAFAIKFTEGGGSSMYRAGMEVKGGELEQRIAAAFRVIFSDEVDHMKTGAEGLRRVVKTPQQWDRVKRLVREVSRQRVLMRNDMFGHPLTEERLREIDEGKIQPFHRDILVS